MKGQSYGGAGPGEEPGCVSKDRDSGFREGVP